MKQRLILRLLTIGLICQSSLSFAAEKTEVTLLGIAGGTGSGKTYLSQKLLKELGDDVVVISQDSYYKGIGPATLKHRDDVNFDHPDAIDVALFQEHLKSLKENKSIAVPVYDFKTSSRQKETTLVEPKKVIIVEGILLYSIPEVRDLLDVKVFVDTDDDLRLLRRFVRDVSERGRPIESISTQYLKTVYPMHKEFVAPSKSFADMIVQGNHEEESVIESIIAKVKK